MGAEMELPPGFRFHPTDDELVHHYLCRKCAGQQISAPVITEIDLYKYDPWQLPDLAVYGEKEWYFFSPRDRKYPNGSRPNRAAGRGYWKATGADKPIGTPTPVGIKKALVFYAGKPPKGVKTNWIMHEYRLANVDRSAPNKNGLNALRLDDWVLCRLYNKKGKIEKHYPDDDVAETTTKSKKLNVLTMGRQDDLLSPPTNDVSHTDVSGCTEHVSSPDMNYDNKEVQSELKWKVSENNTSFGFADLGLNRYLDCLQANINPFDNQVQFQTDQFQPLQDMFMDLCKPFSTF